MGKYDDIINLPHYVSKKRAKMPLGDRAAQFAPFAALTGHNAAIRETARLTSEKIELDEGQKAILNEKLRQLISYEREVQVTITFFQPDKRKSGGKYLNKTGVIEKFDEYKRCIALKDGTEIPIEQVYELDSEILDNWIV